MSWLFNHGHVLMVVTALVWSSNAIIGRAVHEIVPPVGLAFWRWSVALPVFCIMAWPHMRRDLPALLGGWRWMVVLATLSVALYNTIIYVGLNHTTAINMVLINSVRPGMIVLFSFLFFRVKVTPVQIIGLGLGLAGTAVVLTRGELAVLLDLGFNIGDVWIFVASVAWALYTVFLPKRPAIHPASFMAYSVLIGVALMLPFYVWETIAVGPVPLVPESVSAVLFLALFASVFAYLGYNRVVELLGANAAGVTSYLVMAFGVTLAITLLGEAFRPFHAAGLVLLLGGTYLATRREGRAE